MTRSDVPALDRMRFVQSADVYKGERLAGTLKRSESGEVEFSYLDSYAGEPVAFSLPFGKTVTLPGGALPPFFAGLLLEGHRLTVLNRATKTSLDDELTMLLAVGADTPGDVRIFPSGMVPTEPTPLVGDLAESDFRVITDSVDRHAVPGVQAKASASMNNQPISVEGSHAILKIDPPSHPHLVQNEYLHLKAARALKIPVAQAKLRTDSKGCEGLLVTRFDRVTEEGGKLLRLAQEDASQVLEILPAQKYSVPSEEVVRALAERTQAPKIAVRTVYLQFLFAWLIGNGDLHAKNLSILRSHKGVWSVAPIYDVACTALYRDFTMALPIAGRTSKISGRHWDEFADNIGLPLRAARDVQRLALSVATEIDLSRLPFQESPLSGAQKELSSRRLKIESLLK